MANKKQQPSALRRAKHRAAQRATKNQQAAQDDTAYTHRLAFIGNDALLYRANGPDTELGVAARQVVIALSRHVQAGDSADTYPALLAVPEVDDKLYYHYAADLRARLVATDEMLHESLVGLAEAAAARAPTEELLGWGYNITVTWGTRCVLLEPRKYERDLVIWVLENLAVKSASDDPLDALGPEGKQNYVTLATTTRDRLMAGNVTTALHQAARPMVVSMVEYKHTHSYPAPLTDIPQACGDYSAFPAGPQTMLRNLDGFARHHLLKYNELVRKHADVLDLQDCALRAMFFLGAIDTIRENSGSMPPSPALRQMVDWLSGMFSGPMGDVDSYGVAARAHLEALEFAQAYTVAGRPVPCRVPFEVHAKHMASFMRQAPAGSPLSMQLASQDPFIPIQWSSVEEPEPKVFFTTPESLTAKALAGATNPVVRLGFPPIGPFKGLCERLHPILTACCPAYAGHGHFDGMSIERMYGV